MGLLTGFLGVGGGFLVVPALVLALGLPMAYAAGVPVSRRCTGHASDPAAGDPAASGGGWLRRILGMNIRSLWAE